MPMDMIMSIFLGSLSGQDVFVVTHLLGKLSNYTMLLVAGVMQAIFAIL